MSKVYVVTKIARQVEGEYIFVSILGAFRTKEGVDKFLGGQQMRYGEVINDIQCVVEIGITEDVEIIDEVKKEVTND